MLCDMELSTHSTRRKGKYDYCHLDCYLSKETAECGVTTFIPPDASLEHAISSLGLRTCRKAQPDNERRPWISASSLTSRTRSCHSFATFGMHCVLHAVAMRERIFVRNLKRP